MIIRSQDKKRIINFNQITHIAAIFNARLEQWEIYVCYPYCDNAECGCSTIAYYSTEEKAIKVLDMIQEAYMQYATLTNGLGNIQNAFMLPRCFEMPQDSEV